VIVGRGPTERHKPITLEKAETVRMLPGPVVRGSDAPGPVVRGLALPKRSGKRREKTTHGNCEPAEDNHPKQQTPALAGRLFSGASRARTGDLLGAIQALSQLSYSPERRSIPRGPGILASTTLWPSVEGLEVVGATRNPCVGRPRQNLRICWDFTDTLSSRREIDELS
jgi:hypothetical protein